MNNRTYEVFLKAQAHCTDILKQTNIIVNDFLRKNGIKEENVCFVAVGSVGRLEALHASDLDFIPLLVDKKALEEFQPFDKDLRNLLSSNLNLKISEGADLTRSASVSELIEKKAIGGEKDNSTWLTKRVLVLTEGRQAGGAFPLKEIRNKILHAYSGSERTRGRHVLSLCNDVARYYRTLGIEYKAKVDILDKDWCTRNIKLRHSRKFWYFSLIISIVALAAKHPEGEKEYIEGLLDAFELPPYIRIFEAIGDKHGLVGELFDRYAWYLEFMSNKDHRKALTKVTHKDRYNPELSNPFPQMKLNSDMLAVEILRIINSLDSYMKQRVFDWFLF